MCPVIRHFLWHCIAIECGRHLFFEDRHSRREMNAWLIDAFVTSGTMTTLKLLLPVRSIPGASLNRLSSRRNLAATMFCNDAWLLWHLRFGVSFLYESMLEPCLNRESA